MIIAIAGCSGSGKTTLVNKLIKLLSESQTCFLTLDSYYKDQSHISADDREKVNYDHPESIDLELFSSQLKKLSIGESIEKPIYDFVTHTRVGKKEVINPQNIIIVDGIYSLFWKDIRNITDIKVYVDVPLDLCFIRRLQRDVLERGRTMESVITQYLETVRPMHEKYIIPTREYADLIIPQGGLNRDALNDLAKKINEKIKL